MSKSSCVYLDYNATTPIDEEVIKEIHRSLREDWGNASSLYPLGVKARSVVEESRCNVALMIHSKPEDIIFTSGGTEGNNVALLSAIQAAEKVAKGKFKPHVITSNVEHDSVIKVLLDLKSRDRIGHVLFNLNNSNMYAPIELSVADVNEYGILMADSVLCLICEKTCLITIMHANNETGVLMPISEIGEKLKTININRVEKKQLPILFHSDAAQTIGKVNVDVTKLNVDYLTIVGHKFYAPRIGALYARGIGNLTPVFPVILGGGQEKGFRPGTENTAMVAGLGVASKLVAENIVIYENTMKEIRNYFQNLLFEKMPSISCNFTQSNRLPNTLSVLIPKSFKASNILKKCENQFYASLGAACHSGQGKPSAILLASGLSANEAERTIRFSVGRNTSKEDIDFVVDSILQCF